MPRRLWRLTRLALHVGYGVLMVRWRFPGMPPAQRHQHIAGWSAGLLRAAGITLQSSGQFADGAKLIVSNHVSWLDIIAVHALCPQARFVAKSDVRQWPLIGPLVAGAGTLFIARDRPRDARRVADEIAQALEQGDTIAVFPEGTTTDGQAVGPFSAGLLQGAVSSGSAVQAVALRYFEQGSVLSQAAPYVGETSLAQSLWRICSARALVVRLVLLEAQPGPAADRRALAQAARGAIVAALDDA